jgi:large subunit ribosomal protein L20
MPRVKRGNKRKEYRKKILKRASGYFLTKSKLYQAAEEAVERGMKFAYRGRREKKRQFRALWIVRINAAAQLSGISYSQLMHGLKLNGVELDRKVLADLAVNDPQGFAAIATAAKDAAFKQKSDADKANAAKHPKRADTHGAAHDAKKPAA